MRVRIVGTGLIGASVGLALQASGHEVTLEDASPTACALARDIGAGHLPGPDEPEPDVVVVGAPPDVTGEVVLTQLARFPRATVTDVASVKRAVYADVVAGGGDLARYVGSHPMAGRELSGAIRARRDLFEGRPWVVVPSEHSEPERIDMIVGLAEATGAAVTRMDSVTHDEAVAAVSHVPQIASSLVAARLRGLPVESVALAGQGVRDVTRLAASDATLWTKILMGNADSVGMVLSDLVADLQQVADALAVVGADASSEAPGARATLAQAMVAGNSGYERLPGKHGESASAYSVVTVAVPDEPGALGRLFTEMGEESINLEDLRLEHEIGRPIGVAEIFVQPHLAEPLATALKRRGWRIYA